MSKKQKVEAPVLHHEITSQVKEKYHWGTIHLERNLHEDGGVTITIVKDLFEGYCLYPETMNLDAQEARMLVKLLNALVGPIEIGE